METTFRERGSRRPGRAVFRRSMPVFDEGLLQHDVVLGFPANRESAQEELDRAAAKDRDRQLSLLQRKTSRTRALARSLTA